MSKQMGRIAGALWTVAALLAPMAASAGVPTTITFSSRIVDNGTPLDGTYALGFTLYDAASGGTPVWQETHGSVAVTGGIVQLELGTTSTLDAAVFDGTPLYLEVAVGATTLSPRMPVVSVPYAFRSVQADDAMTLAGMAAAEFRAAADPIPWSDLSSVPADLADGDNDTLGSLVCTTGQVPKRSASAWICGTDIDTTLSLAGSGTATSAAHSDHNHDTTYYTQATLNTAGTINAVSNPVTWTKLKGVPTGFADGVDNDSGGDVTGVGVIVNGGLQVANTNGPVPSLGLTSCNAGQVLRATGSSTWGCGGAMSYLVQSGSAYVSGGTARNSVFAEGNHEIFVEYDQPAGIFRLVLHKIGTAVLVASMDSGDGAPAAQSMNIDGTEISKVFTAQGSVIRVRVSTVSSPKFEYSCQRWASANVAECRQERFDY